MRIYALFTAIGLLLAGTENLSAQNYNQSGSAAGNSVIAPPPISNSNYSGYGSYGSNPGTAAGSYLYGLGDVVRAQGEYNLNSSAAAVNLTEARRRELDNWKNYVDAYYYTRRVYQNELAEKTAKDRKYNEEWVRNHASMKPQRLQATELDPLTGKIQWPVVLRTGGYEDQCAQLQKLFQERAKYGALSYESYQKVTKLTNAILADLRTNIRNYSSNDWLAAKDYLEKLAYEAGMPTT
jgi:hypothetical protein